jgi:deferrochelatase/peroxidase EfeB
VVAPGEFILGYGDNRGDTPSSPVVAAEHDRVLLPSLTSDLPGRFPGFEPGRASSPRDFGRNGSYLVIRQLEQDAKGFHAHVQQQADRLNQDFPSAPITAKLVAAKMVGRWQDGSSLVRNPFEPANKPDNEFLYGVEDPQGVRCPYGAHVRRAFPRDSLSPDAPSQLSISNRHRLLRRGRAYKSSEEGEARGLLFMCLNSDIERQFEFVQQTWITSPNFHGLAGEPDPLASSAPDAERRQKRDLTIPTPSGQIALKDIQSFVTVRNGGYFFLPSRSAILFLANLKVAPA